jgi:hypothetical protein
MSIRGQSLSSQAQARPPGRGNLKALSCQGARAWTLYCSAQDLFATIVEVLGVVPMVAGGAIWGKVRTV